MPIPKSEVFPQPFPSHCPEGDGFGAQEVLANEDNKVKCQHLLALWSVGLKPVWIDFAAQERRDVWLKGRP